jgi:UDP-glucose 4-epimerase
VRQIMDAMARVTGIDFEPEVQARRPGDPDRIVASGKLAARDLDWRMRHTVDDMVASAWQARRAADTNADEESR